MATAEYLCLFSPAFWVQPSVRVSECSAWECREEAFFHFRPLCPSPLFRTPVALAPLCIQIGPWRIHRRHLQSLKTGGVIGLGGRCYSAHLHKEVTACTYSLHRLLEREVGLREFAVGHSTLKVVGIFGSKDIQHWFFFWHTDTHGVNLHSDRWIILVPEDRRVGETLDSAA